MGEIVARIRALAFTLGAPGLFLVAFLDSSFLSLPQIADLLVIWTVARHKTRFVLYVLCATLGSMTGCSVMYFVGRKGGEALVRRRFATGRIERVMASLKRHGMMAVLIPAILPPPTPFKLFVLLAGASGIKPTRFLTAIAIGRGTRYSVLGLLAVKYGDSAMAYLAENRAKVSVVVGVALLTAFLTYLGWSRTRSAKRT